MYDVAFDLSQTISTQNPKKIFSKNLEMSKYLLFMSLVDPFENLDSVCYLYFISFQRIMYVSQWSRIQILRFLEMNVFKLNSSIDTGLKF